MLNKHESYHDLDPILKLLGPHGNPHKSKMGDSILNLMHEHSLRAAIPSLTATTNIIHGWDSQIQQLAKEKGHQLDRIFIPHQQLHQTTNAKWMFDSVVSDHVALLIEFHFLSAFKKVLMISSTAIST
jgi:hypothetical protein